MACRWSASGRKARISGIAAITGKRRIHSVAQDMTEQNLQYAYFTVAGEFDPAAISQQIGVRPSEAWAKGDINPRTQMERKASRWSLHSRLDRTSALEAHVSDVLAQMTECRDRFIDISSRLGGVMQLVAYFNSGYPGLHFDAATVRSLGEFALEVDFDFYW